MNRIVRIPILFTLALLFFCSVSPAETGALYDKYSRAAEVKVFVASPKEVGISGKIDAAALKLALEKALQERKSIKFKIVPSASDAELVVETDLHGYYFTEHDPVDMLVGVGMAAMDAAKQDHFVRLESAHRILDAKSGKALWKDALIASLTDEKMTEAEAKIKILDRAADVFVRTAFGRAKRDR